MHVAHVWMETTDALEQAMIKPIEVGARGQAIQLWAVHYHVYGIKSSGGNTMLGLALCENPDLAEKFYPGGAAGFGAGFSQDDFQKNGSLYGRHVWRHRSILSGTDGYLTKDHQSAIVPLYGLVRPRRQGFVAVGVGFATEGSTDFDVGAEIYYTAVGGPPELIQAVALTRGKYRRN